ncbi:hypothetical protein B0T14DRAFT_565775 [Immersiella caudata]|uniref:Uncharacterized protein n=1 Tax=Immersiella caudata TaxID=314043 RepID=A0AA39WNV5_9PEZI|nr:hypothetical protein B0T14DRAFT_565775 [Immersiella caudata]
MDPDYPKALAPGAYWDKFLKQALATRVQDKLPEPKYGPDETKITVSVEKRNERDLRKRFDGTNIEWEAVEDKLRAWSHLFRDGKKLRVDICFICKETTQPVAARTRSSARARASRRQLAVRDELLAEQEAVSGMRPVWKEIYELLRCNGAFCTNKGFYCWREPSTQKHYKLETTVLEKLVDFAEEGNTLRTHENVPEDIRQLLREQEELLLDRRRRKRKNADDQPDVNIHVCCRGHDRDSDGCDKALFRWSDDSIPRDYSTRRPYSLVDFLSFGTLSLAGLNRFDLFVTYRTIVEEYTKRDLSYQRDALPAIDGVLRLLNPRPEANLAGLPKEFFVKAILWHPKLEESCIEMTEPGVPSWSWARWKFRQGCTWWADDTKMTPHFEAGMQHMRYWTSATASADLRHLPNDVHH